ncbi:unnamed protein product [Lymnaea stagnalis]|uniref:N-acetyltransferase 9-like protein n=1 Tax=Lymnaea stagnalis TaxID=6523 RepID=A0AAV2HC03_LYMST
MRENKSIRLFGSKVLLVPYESFHVEKYHNWMESAELRELTASERLTLEQEYEMQKKWREDCDKCTFIVLDRHKYENWSSTDDSHNKEISAMVGDVNIFYPPDSHDRSEGEVEIMIAEPSARGRGLGKEALCTLMKFAQETLHTTTFTSKIGFENNASIHLFQILGFQEVSRSDVFKEITLTLDASDPEIFLPYTKNYSVEIKK